MKNVIFTLLGILTSTVLAGQSCFDSATIHISSSLNVNRETSTSDVPLFNFNPVITGSNISDFEYKNKLDHASTLFIAYSNQTDADIQNEIIRLTAGKDNIKISNQGITRNGLFNAIDSKNGVIVCYQFKLDKIKKNNLLSIKSYVDNSTLKENYLMELMYFPRVLDEKTKGIAESFFSIKYGISLTDTANYFASNGDTLWNRLINESFNNRITGIGRDDSNGLNQLQSHNSIFKGFTVGLNDIIDCNYSQLGKFEKDKTFLLWGDNDGSVRFETEDAITDNIDRKWKFKYLGDGSILTSIEIDSSYFLCDDTNPDKIFWMVRSEKDSLPLFESEIIRQNPLTSTIQFNNIEFTKGNPDQFLSFIKAPEFFGLHQISNACSIINNWSVNVRIIGGLPPFRVSLSNGFENYKITDSSFIDFNDLVPGTYILKISDSENRYYTEEFQFNGIIDSPYIKNEWVIAEHGYTDLIPEEQNRNLEYNWYDKGELISNETRLRVFEEGTYVLRIIDNKGCSLDKEVNVKMLNDENITIYPNPVPRNKLFTIETKIPQLGNYVVIITDGNGKVIRKFSRDKRDPSNFKESISSPGTYLITLVSDNKSYVAKLIVI